MEWTEEGVILGTRHHGETSAIVELFTENRGRHLGLVRGGRSRRNRVVLQPGNSVVATWRARLDEHLGIFLVEPSHSRAANLMQSSVALYGLAVLTAHLRLLPERDPHAALYHRVIAMLGLLSEPLAGAVALNRFELFLLAELGFGLDLDRCAATGSSDDLIYVSPKSGRAVSRAAGHPYRERLLCLPDFLRDEVHPLPDPIEICHGFALTEYFLMRHVHMPRRLPLPPERQRVLDAIRRLVA